MKHLLYSLLLTVLMSMISTSTFAYDIAVKNEDGVTIYYNYINNYTELEVTATKTEKYSGEFLHYLGSRITREYYRSWGYEGIETLKIPSEVTYNGRTRKVTAIAARTFCGYEEDVQLETTMQYNFYGAFIKCIYLPPTIKSIGSDAFRNCRFTRYDYYRPPTMYDESTLLHKVVINDIKSFLEISGTGNLCYQGTRYSIYLNNEDNRVSDITVPEGIKNLRGPNRCALETLTIGNDVETINLGGSRISKVDIQGDKITELSGFSSCSIDTFMLGKSINKIASVPKSNKVIIAKDLSAWCKIEISDNNWYSYLEKLIILDYNGKPIEHLDFPEGVTYVNPYVFCRLSGVKSLALPSNVEFGEYNFAGCPDLESIVISDGVEEIPVGMFYGCSKLNNIKWGNSVKSIGSSAFSGCAIPSLSLPDGINYIGHGSFYGCPLKSVVIPKTVNYIGGNAFWTNTLQTVIPLFVDNIPDAGDDSDNAFSKQTLINNATLYVPAGTLEKYKSTKGWKDFVWVEEGTPSGVVGVKADTDNKEVSRYSVDGRKLTMPHSGINIIKMSNGTTKKVIVK